MNKAILLLIVLGIYLSGCTVKKESPHSTHERTNTFTHIKYAKKFNIQSHQNGTKVSIIEPWKGAGEIHYFLGEHKPKNLPKETIFIKTPLESVIPVSTSHIPMIEALGRASSIVGFPNTDYISSERVRELIDRDSITDIGNEMDFNLEKIAEVSPDLIIGYAINSPDSYETIEKAGVKTFFNADYLEMHPLGRAEWIKIFGLFFNEYKKADSIFSSIEEKYLSTKKLIKAGSAGTVFSGSLYGESWFMPGGKNYAARLLKDAGYQYVWSNDSSNSFLKKSFESVYQKAKDADYWISPAPFSNLTAMKNSEERYSYFKAYANSNIWCYDKDLGEKGGNNYLELGYLRPDIILKDLIAIHSPELLPEYNIVFYRKLK